MAEGKILLINDDAQVSARFQRLLGDAGGYSLEIEPTQEAALVSFRENNFDLVVIRFDMPFLDRQGLVRDLKKIDPEAIILAYLTDENPALMAEVSRLGIYEIIREPLNEEKILFLAKKGVELHALILANRKLSQGLQEQNASLQRQNILLAQRVEDSTKNLSRLYEDLRTTYMRTIRTLAQVIDARDHYTHSHSENVARIAVAIAEEMHLFAKDIELIREASELHDIGKIGIQDNILIKPAELKPEEWEVMKRHPLTGAEILEPLTFLHGVIELIRQHHEHYDGAGYPQGLKGEEILPGARIIHLADAFEAMTSARSYREVPLTKEKAIEEIKKERGKQFDPNVVDAFLKVAPGL